MQWNVCPPSPTGHLIHFHKCMRMRLHANMHFSARFLRNCEALARHEKANRVMLVTGLSQKWQCGEYSRQTSLCHKRSSRCQPSSPPPLPQQAKTPWRRGSGLFALSVIPAAFGDPGDLGEEVWETIPGLLPLSFLCSST